MKIEERIEALEQREKHCLEAFEKMEKELDKMKALYEGLHGAVSKDLKGCDHEWSVPATGNGYQFCIKAKCLAEKFADNPTKTLAERIKHDLDNNNHNTRQEASECFARLAESHYSPLLKKEYQRGLQDGNKGI